MFLWNRVIVPLSICLLALIILALIIFVFNVIETMIYTKIEEWNARKRQKELVNTVSKNVMDIITKELKNNIK